MTVPNFLIAGAGRSGTTGLVEGLKTHPRVFVTHPKEPHYFALHGEKVSYTGPGDAATINRVAVTDRAQYLALFPETHDYLALGDGSVSTLYFADKAVPEIQAMNADMRIVILLREPVDRAYSSFQYMRARGFEPEEDFLAAVADEQRRRDEGWHHLWHYTNMSRYAEGVSALQAAFGERAGIWFYDDLVADYQGTVGSVLRFLGLPELSSAGANVPRVNISGTPKLRSVQRVIWWTTRNEALRSSVKRLTSYRFREAIRRLSLHPSAVPPLARRELEDRFRTDLKELSHLVPGEAPSWLNAAR